MNRETEALNRGRMMQDALRRIYELELAWKAIPTDQRAQWVIAQSPEYKTYLAEKKFLRDTLKTISRWPE